MKLLIDFKSDATQESIDAYLQEHNCTIVKQYQNYTDVYLVDHTGTGTLPVTDIIDSIVPDDTQPLTLLDVNVELNPNVTYGTIETTEQNDWWKVASLMSPDFDKPSDAYPINGKGVTVYMMDSGIDATHAEFAQASVRLLYSFNGDFLDTSGHGTALSSVIVGKTCGMTAADLVVVKVFADGVETKQSDLLAAFDAIITDYLATGKKAAVLNMSWGIPKNQYIEDKIATLIEAGVYAVAAAGNSGIEIADVTPASMAPVITIGSYSEDFKPSDFSNYTGSSAVSVTDGAVNGGALDGWAPGENIYAAIPGGTYGNVSGTSIAAAIHTAAIAYNLFDNLDSSGQIGVAANSTTEYLAQFMGEIGFYRRNMVHLDDPKYASSVNLVTTFKTHTSDVITGAAAEFKVNSDQVWSIIVAKPVAVASITCNSLPDGITLDGGILHGSIALPAGSTWKYYEINLTFTLRDGGETPYQVRVWVVGASFDVAAPDTDSALKIIPYIGSTCNSTTCVANGCSSCHNCGDTKQPACYCVNTSCP